MGFTRDLISWLDQIEINQDEISFAQLLFKDWLGCVVAGLVEKENRRNLQLLGLFSERQNSEKLSTSELAFVLGVSSHCLELDDSEFFSETHPSAVIFSSLLALSPAERPLVEVIRSAICGFYALVPIGERFNPKHYATGWHGTGTLAPFAAVLAAGKMLEISKDQKESALGHVCTMVSGMHNSFGSYSKYLNSGAAARSSVVATLLSQGGVEGPKDIFERELGAFEMLSANKVHGSVFPKEINLNFIKSKKYPLCHCILPLLDSYSELLLENKIQRSEISRLKIHISGYSRNILKFDDPRNRSEAYFSLPYALTVLTMNPSASCLNFFEPLQECDWKTKFVVDVVMDPDLMFLDHKIEIEKHSKVKIVQEFQVDRGFGTQNRAFIADKFNELVTGFVVDPQAFQSLKSILDGEIANCSVGFFSN